MHKPLESIERDQHYIGGASCDPASDIKRAQRMSRGLRAGTVWVNTYRAVSYMSPFGGYRQSGTGRES